MADQTFIYHGPTSGVTLVLEDGSEREVMLYQGFAVKLPPDHPYTRSLVAQGTLTPAPATKADPAADAEPVTRKSKER